jgi:hypothetical protein
VSLPTFHDALRISPGFKVPHEHLYLANILSWPSNSLLPTQLLDKAAHNVLKDRAIAFPALSYGPDPGDPRLRKNVASWLTKFYQPADTITEERICITGGASQNLACLLQVYSDPVFTRNVWIVAPAYMLSFRVFEDAGFHKKLRAIPEDDEGIDIEYLRSEIRKSESKAKAESNDKPVRTARTWEDVALHQCNILALLVAIQAHNSRLASVQSQYANPPTRSSNLRSPDHGLRFINISYMQCRHSQTPASRP